MFTTKQFFKTLLATLVAIGMLLIVGEVFVMYLAYSWGTIASLWVYPTILGYIFIVVNLVRLKKWAWEFFSVIFFLALLLQAIGISILKTKISFVESFPSCVFIASLAMIPVFVIFVLIRRLRKKKNQ